MKYITCLIFLLVSSMAFSQDLAHISESDTIYLVLPQNDDFKEVKLDFSNFKLSYIGSKEYGTNQYSLSDESGNGRISLNTQDDSTSPYMIKNNITVQGPEFMKRHKNSIITLKDIQNMVTGNYFLERLKFETGNFISIML